MTTRSCRSAHLTFSAVTVLVAVLAAACNAPARSTTLEAPPTSTPATSTTVFEVPVLPTLPLPPAPTTTTLPPPAGLVQSVQAKLADPAFGGTTVGLSVWVEGTGEVVTHNPDLLLRPGSNEKILVGAAVLATAGPEAQLVTEVRTAGTQVGSTIWGDVVLVGSGDPTLRSRGPHSLDALAAQIRGRGVTEIVGDLIADESRYDSRRRATGWTERHMPTFVGSLSALAVDGNWYRTDPEYLAEPAVGNVGLFRESLRRVGVNVTGGDRAGQAPRPSEVVAAVSSPPMAALVQDMMSRSDNFMAELLLKEVGWRGSGVGSSANGVAYAEATFETLGVKVSGKGFDGSGLSRDNARSAREWRAILGAARAQPWGAAFANALPLAGRTGTLVNRFRGLPGEGQVRAKTGSVREARALSGYLTTAGGRDVVFSLIVNGATASNALAAMDNLVAAMVESPA